MSQWYVEEGTVAPRNQAIIYSRDVLVFFVPRRAHTLNIGRLVAPMQAHFNRLPRTVAGFDRLNDTTVDFDNHLTLHNGDHSYELKSVVVVEINDSVAGPTGQGQFLITGCSALVRRDPTDQFEPDKIYWYNPRGAAVGHVPGVGENNDTHYEKPVSFIGEGPGSTSEDFYSKASRRGTIFIYKQQGDSTLQQLIAY